MFFSRAQIEQSIKRLYDVNPFFGIVFLVFKDNDLPVGTTKKITFAQITNDFLQKYFPYYRPSSDPKEYRIYIPFKTSRSTRWHKEPYVSALDQIARNTFSEAVEHPKGSLWGWKGDYIKALTKELKKQLIPAFDLAVWLFRNRNWDETIQPEDVINIFFSEFPITDGEKVLFNTSIPALVDEWLDIHAITDDALWEIIGPPDDKVVEGVTLKLLRMHGTGPVRSIECLPASRLNLITGDNGLGKTFLLECAWWALTSIWAGYPARPRRDTENPTIAFQVGKNGQSQRTQKIAYNWEQLKWDTPEKRSVLPGLSLFSRSDGSFVVWDPAKHLLPQEVRGVRKNEEGLIRFSRSQVWDGIREVEEGQVKVMCEGLISDWVRWQEARDQTRFDRMKEALHALSPASEEFLVPGEPIRMPEIGDSRDIPTLRFPYGEVPILLCSAGIQRIVALAYLLVWTWQEHLRTVESMGREPEKSIVLIVDEVEAHLHPQWQRVIIPSLLNVVKALSGDVEIQLLIATHSPLVLASVEPIFNENKDSLFQLALDKEDGMVQLNTIPFVKMGSIDRWLVSDVFGLEQARSLTAETAIAEANEIQLEKNPSSERIQQLNETLINVLGAEDEYWPTWRYFITQRREKVN